MALLLKTLNTRPKIRVLQSCYKTIVHLQLENVLSSIHPLPPSQKYSYITVEKIQRRVFKLILEPYNKPQKKDLPFFWPFPPPAICANFADRLLYSLGKFSDIIPSLPDIYLLLSNSALT